MKYKQPSHHARQAIGCVRCSSKNLGKFSAEVNIHFPGYEGLTEPLLDRRPLRSGHQPCNPR